MNKPENQQSLHVAFMIEGLFNLSGGAERVLADITRQLYLRGHKVTVITYEGRNGPSFYPLEFGIDRIDARPRHSRRKKRPPLAPLDRFTARSALLGMPIWLIQMVPKIVHLRRALKRSRPDVAVAFMPSMFPYATFAAQGLGIKTVASLHNVPARELGADKHRWSQNKFDIRMRRLSLRLADAVTVLLPSFKGQLTRPSVQQKTHDIPNMVWPNQLHCADVSTDPEKNVILAVGRYAKAKDHQSLIEAWAKLEDQYPSWEVKIYGSGPLKESLKRKIRILGLKRLKLVKPTKDIMAEYRGAKILAMPSRHEGFGLVTAEALSCGLPVVGFRSSEGTNELVQHEVNGLLAKSKGGRAKGFKNALVRLIDDETLRKELAAAAPASVERFSPEVVADQWEALISGLAGRK